MKRLLTLIILISLIPTQVAAAPKTKSFASDPRISKAAAFSSPSFCKTIDKSNDGWPSSGFPRNENALLGKSKAKILVLPINFSDYKFTNQDRANYESNFNKVTEFYSKMSYGKFKTEFEFAPQNLWVSLPLSADKYGVTNNLPQQDHSDFLERVYEVAPAELNLPKYDSVFLITDMYRETGIGQAFMGTKYQTKSGEVLSTVLLAGRGGTAWASSAHELGHALFYLEDLYLFQKMATGTKQSNNSINGWDLMSGYTPDFTGWNKLLMGFIDDSEVKCITDKKKKIIYFSNGDKSGANKLGVINIEPGVSLCFEAKKDFDGATGLLVYKVDTNFSHGNGPFGGIEELIKGGKSYSDSGNRFKVLGVDKGGLLVQVN